MVHPGTTKGLHSKQQTKTWKHKQTKQQEKPTAEKNPNKRTRMKWDSFRTRAQAQSGEKEPSLGTSLCPIHKYCLQTKYSNRAQIHIRSSWSGFNLAPLYPAPQTTRDWALKKARAQNLSFSYNSHMKPRPASNNNTNWWSAQQMTCDPWVCGRGHSSVSRPLLLKSSSNVQLWNCFTLVWIILDFHVTTNSSLWKFQWKSCDAQILFVSVLQLQPQTLHSNIFRSCCSLHSVNYQNTNISVV